ncbi:UDP-3-O-(3-hydroxymyristoyl)glucosamine N-acyltransferase [Mucilaginibacter sp.]|uniref:UDP-3-O-(3-hydroxymyristoyl)glucosamine N-acyltransferase n=1 Tax=Mucilaginibacter sp. TaxID=1882438 RepID=UPI003AFFE7A4
MQLTALEISLLLNGTIEGKPEVTVNQLAKIEEAEAGSLSFLANPKYEQYLYTTQASILIIDQGQVLTEPVNATLIRVENPYIAISVLLDKYNQSKLAKPGIEQPSFVHPTAKLGKDVYIGAFSYIGANVVLGDNCRIYPNSYVAADVVLGNNVTVFAGVKIYFDCKIGNDVTLHSGVIIGGDGFGFAPQGDGTYQKVAQIGNVIIEDDVEIGANTTIDRATMGSTIIRRGVKLDNLIQIAHNVEIGSNTVVAAQTGISGSTKIGENVVLGGQVGVVGHIQIAKGSQVQAQSGISRTIKEENKKWAGAPATNYQDHMRSQIRVNRLPELEKKIQELEKKLADLQQPPELYRKPR